MLGLQCNYVARRFCCLVSFSNDIYSQGCPLACCIDNLARPGSAASERTLHARNAMELESYFDFFAPDDIRVKGTRVGIETVLYEYIHRANLLDPDFRKRHGTAKRGWGN